MILSVCSKHFHELGLEVRGRLVYGMYREYPLVMQLQGSGDTVGSIVIRIQLQDTMDKKQRKEFKKLLKKRCQIVFTGHTVQLTIRTFKDFSLTECDDLLNTMIQFFTENYLIVSENCPICGQSSCDSAVFYNGAYQKAHAHCITAAMEHLADKAEKNQNNGNYALGLLGALLGGLVGIIPNLLTIYWTETIYSLLYALIPICIYWGYRLLRGVMNKSAIILTIILSIIDLFIMEFVLLVISVYMETNGMILIKECFEVFTDPVIFKEILSEMTSSFIFLALGIFYSWRMISDNNDNVFSNVEFTLSTLMPLRRPVPADPVAENISGAIPASSSDTMESHLL